MANPFTNFAKQSKIQAETIELIKKSYENGTPVTAKDVQSFQLEKINAPQIKAVQSAVSAIQQQGRNQYLLYGGIAILVFFFIFKKG